MTKTQAKWSTRVTEWRASGQRAEQFAEGKGFKGSTLRWWATRLGQAGREAASDPSPPAAPIAFARVLRAEVSASRSPLTLVVGAARIELLRGFDAELLREVITALGGAT